jgi:uncharacterized protein (DUF488 family)
MRNTQRSILYFIADSQKPLLKTSLVKLLFLVSNEIKDMGIPFYGFVPYKYGPFSFVLYQDINKLINEGWINNSLEMNDDRKGTILGEICKVGNRLSNTLEWVQKNYGTLSDKELLKLVYSRFPEFTYFSEIEKRLAPPEAPVAIYTMGYQGTTVDDFLNKCIQKGIKRLLDVRRNAISRVWGFARSSLSNICNKVGIEYMHIPELGISGEKRRNLKTKNSYLHLLEYYKKHILPQKQNELINLLNLIKEKASVLLCMEAEAAICHRRCIAEVLSRWSNLPIFDM